MLTMNPFETTIQYTKRLTIQYALFGMVACHRIKALGIYLNEPWIKITKFVFKKRIWKCRLQNVDHFA